MKSANYVYDNHFYLNLCLRVVLFEEERNNFKEIFFLLPLDNEITNDCLTIRHS